MTSPWTTRTVLPWLLAVAIAVVPLWTVAVPPMLDYHNHLARQYILANIAGSEFLGEFYRLNWRASPYLALDGIVQALVPLLSVDVAGKVFLALMLFMLGLAPVALNLALFGRVTPFALLGLLFVHNETVTFGFVNYLFGIGLGLCAFALWIRLRVASPWVRLAVFPVVCSLVFFSHLLGFVIYVLAVGSYELGCYVHAARQGPGHRTWRPRSEQWINLLSLALQCAVPLTIYSLWGPLPGGGTLANNTYGDLARKFDLLFGAFSYLVPAYLWTPDRVLQVALPVSIALALLLRRAVIDVRMLLPLVSVLLLFFAMPMELFGGWGADHRLLPALGLLLVGSLRPTALLAKRTETVALAVVVAMVVMRVIAVTGEWRKTDRRYAEYVRAFDAVPDGSTMYFAFGHAGNKAMGLSPVYQLPTLVLSRRDVYVPYLFVRDSGVMPVAYQRGWKPLQTVSRGPTFTNGESPDWTELLPRYDYFYLVNEKHFKDPVPSSLTRVFDGPNVKVYKGPRTRSAP